MKGITGQNAPPIEERSNAMPSMAYAPVVQYSEITPISGETLGDDASYTLPPSREITPTIPLDTQRILDTVKIAMSFVPPPPRVAK